MSNETFQKKQKEQFSIHIFYTSAVIIGVCLTIIGILSLSAYRGIELIGDEITTFVAMLFLLSCICSYTAIRTKGEKVFFEKNC